MTERRKQRTLKKSEEEELSSLKKSLNPFFLFFTLFSSDLFVTFPKYHRHMLLDCMLESLCDVVDDDENDACHAKFIVINGPRYIADRKMYYYFTYYTLYTIYIVYIL